MGIFIRNSFGQKVSFSKSWTIEKDVAKKVADLQIQGFLKRGKLYVNILFACIILTLFWVRFIIVEPCLLSILMALSVGALILLCYITIFLMAKSLLLTPKQYELKLYENGSIEICTDPRSCHEINKVKKVKSLKNHIIAEESQLGITTYIVIPKNVFHEFLQKIHPAPQFKTWKS